MNILNSLKTTALTALLVAALPAAASAMTVGVSNETDTSITSGHYCSSNSYQENHQGSEASSSSALKWESGTGSAATSGSAVDPADSTANENYGFKEVAGSSSSTSGTYSSQANQSSSVTGGVQVNTSIVHTVSAFAQP